MIKITESLVIQFSIKSKGKWTDSEIVETIEEGKTQIEIFKYGYPRLDFVLIKRRETLEEEVVE